jgi:hypothetical protein
MRDLVRLSVFLAFLGLGLRVALASAPMRRSRVNALLVYVLCVSSAAGFLQRDSWPFAANRIFYHSFAARHVFERFTLQMIDREGRDCDPDPHFASPVTLMTVLEWLEHAYPALSESEQQEVMRFLFDRARRAGDRTAAGGDPLIARMLGSLAPPSHWALYTLTIPKDLVRCMPYGGLRLYQDTWRPRERFVDPRRVERRLITEYRAP